MSRTTRLCCLTLFALATAACSDRKEVGAELLEDVEAGYPRDSLLTLVGQGPLTAHYSDTLRVIQGFRHSRYFAKGGELEVLYYREAPGDVTEPVKQDRETPIILSKGKVLGWGWKYYVEEGMEELGLPTPLKEELALPAVKTPTPTDSAARGTSAPKGPKA
jgi:hypothetical protein